MEAGLYEGRIRKSLGSKPLVVILPVDSREKTRELVRLERRRGERANVPQEGGNGVQKTCFLRANLGPEGSSCGCVPGVRPVHHFSGGVICAGSISGQAVEGSYGQQHGGQQREQDPLVLFISSGSDGDFQADPNNQ